MAPKCLLVSTNDGSSVDGSRKDSRTTRDFMEGGWAHRHRICALRPDKLRLPVSIIENSNYWTALLVGREFSSLAKLDR
jgi:hypothetical protein